jgi:hypothetical protein
VIGGRIVAASWVSLAIFAVVAIPDALGASVFETPAAIVSLGLFLISLPIWIYSFGLVIVRSSRGDNVEVISWVFLTGNAAPREIRRHLLGATAVSIVLGLATAWANPFSVLVPMLSLGFAALWGARHGTYPARPEPVAVKGGRR